MLRITAVTSMTQVRTLRLEGQLIGPWVKELERSREEARTNGALLVLDLAGVSFIDNDGLAFLQGLTDGTVTLINPSHFVAEQMKGAGL
jgi:ABC-type transporter Mla MlaB component